MIIRITFSRATCDVYHLQSVGLDTLLVADFISSIIETTFDASIFLNI